MSGPRPRLGDMPTWPRLLSEPQAAAYVGLSVNTFRGNIGGIFPAPVYIGKRKLFDRLALDGAVDTLSAQSAQREGGPDER